MDTSVSAVLQAKRRISKSESNDANVSPERKFWSESAAVMSAEMEMIDTTLFAGKRRRGSLC